MPRRPNLFVVGAMKSGTSYLNRLLQEHPAIFMSPRKEPHYFGNAKLRLTDRKIAAPYGTEARRQAYLSLFEGARDETFLGEASTSYAKMPRSAETAQRIADFSPKARIVYLMRDPVKRSISHYWHRVDVGGETRPIFEAIRNFGPYLGFSDYPLQLRPYFQAFPREQILATTFEELLTAPRAVLGDIWRWLGVDDTVMPMVIGIPKNVTPEIVRRRRNFAGSRYLVQIMRAVNSRRLKTIGRWMLRSPLLSSNVTPSEAETRKTVEFLRSRQLEQAAALSEMLGREFPLWTTLYADEDGPGHSAE